MKRSDLIVGNEQYEMRVLELLKKTARAVSTDYVAFHLNIGWGTARALLMELALAKKVEAEKTTSGWIFRSLE